MINKSVFTKVFAALLVFTALGMVSCNKSQSGSSGGDGSGGKSTAPC